MKLRVQRNSTIQLTLDRRLTYSEAIMLDCIHNTYCGIAETANLEYELSWTPRTIAGVGRSLKKKGRITISPGAGTMEHQHGGSFYKTIVK